MNLDHLHTYPGFAASFGAVGNAALLKVALRPELLKTWLALSSVNYQRNVKVSILLDQWLAQTVP